MTSRIGQSASEIPSCNALCGSPARTATRRSIDLEGNKAAVRARRNRKTLDGRESKRIRGWAEVGSSEKVMLPLRCAYVVHIIPLVSLEWDEEEAQIESS